MSILPNIFPPVLAALLKFLALSTFFKLAIIALVPAAILPRLKLSAILLPSLANLAALVAVLATAPAPTTTPPTPPAGAVATVAKAVAPHIASSSTAIDPIIPNV